MRSQPHALRVALDVAGAIVALGSRSGLGRSGFGLDGDPRVHLAETLFMLGAVVTAEQ